MRLLDECFGGFGCSRVWPLSFFLVLSFVLFVWLITVWLLWGWLCGLVWSGGVIGLLSLCVGRAFGCCARVGFVFVCEGV